MTSFVPRSNRSGIVWPAIPKQDAAQVLALRYQIEQSEWWEPERIRRAQLTQLALLLDHAYGHVPFYRQRLGALGYRQGMRLSEEFWSRIPILSKFDAQTAGVQLDSTALPESHGPIQTMKTSGSTGTPVTIRKSAIAFSYFDAIILRMHDWHGMSFSSVFCAIHTIDRSMPAERLARYAYPQGVERQARAGVVGRIYPTGRYHELDIQTPVHQQVEWLSRKQPNIIFTFPTNVLALARYCDDEAITFPDLHYILCFGEVCSDELRQTCHTVFGARVVDSYSSEEAGVIAVLCPDCRQYHVAAEANFVEIVDAQGQACLPGEIGRVVITPLHNFATPLIRYEIGDHAQVGRDGECGRGLPTLARVLGRTRNMMRLPDGGTFWPQLGGHRYPKIAPITRFQLAQTSLDRLELRVIASRDLTGDERRQLGSLVLANLPCKDFQVDVVRLPAIPNGPTGKFEDFRCEIVG